jgi:hypothetical protein
MHSQAMHKIKKARKVMPIFKSRSFSFPKYARQGAAKKKPAQKNGLMEYELVAWTGIEPVTRGFSTLTNHAKPFGNHT